MKFKTNRTYFKYIFMCQNDALSVLQNSKLDNTIKINAKIIIANTDKINDKHI